MIYLVLIAGWLLIVGMLCVKFGFRKVWSVCLVLTIINIVLSWLIFGLKTIK
ncbi:MAG: hypothetical protein MJ016_07675 [Victivallaceae bacterium]|nr:hypothetical protein [Victivallaceae bacterium]